LFRLIAGRTAPLLGALTVTVGLIALVSGGCTSETQNLVGTSLISSQVDTVLRPLAVRNIDDYSPIAVVDEAEPFDQAQVLYFGRQGSESSSILLNYDFSTLQAEGWLPDIVNAENITAVKLVMIRLEHYSKLPSGGRGDFHNPALKSYAAYQLDQTYDAQDYPGPLPPSNPLRLNENTEPRSTGGVTLIIDTNRFLEWYAAEDSIGVIVTEGVHPDSDDGFVGYASRDLTRFSELAPEWEGTTVPPKLQIEFADTTNLLIAPYADISSFDQVDSAPTDLSAGFMLRTHLRDYPWLLYDFSQLPANVFINRAVLAVANDTTRAYGPGFEAIVVSELDSTFVPAAGDTLTTTWIGNNVYEINGQLSLKPWETTRLNLIVTSAVQRMVNEVYTGRRGFLLTAGEAEFASVAGAGFDPGLLMQRFWFYGDDAPADSLRPYLQITYTRTNELTGEGR